MSNQLGPAPKAKPTIGFVILLLGLFVYAVLVTTVGAWLTDWPVLVQTLYYIIAGIAWIWPARRVLVWALAGNEVEDLHR